MHARYLYRKQHGFRATRWRRYAILTFIAHALHIATPLFSVWDQDRRFGRLLHQPLLPPPSFPNTMDKETVTDEERTHIDAKGPGLSLSLPSNNPFRNRTTSPVPVASGQLSPMEPPPRPLSRNPFLDDAGVVKESLLQRLPSPSSNPAPLTGSAAELFVRFPLLPIPRS